MKTLISNYMAKQDKRKDRNPYEDGNEHQKKDEPNGTLLLIEEMKKRPNTGGRPPHYETAEELQQRIDEYVVWATENHVKLTITGLVLFCDFADRSSFYDYEKKEEFTYTIKRARSYIESAYEQNLHNGACGGSIFALKNFGWEDKQVQEQQGAVIHINKTYNSKEDEQEFKDQ